MVCRLSVSESSIAAANAEALLARARIRIADGLLGPDTPWRIGEITLHPHQQRAAHRLDLLMRIHGGAMLADATGLGKTFVALAIAARFERVLVVAPASLADAWRRSTTRTGVNARFISFERLSRGLSSGVGTPELVIIDEAHHLRNTRTRRYAAAAELCDRTQVDLLKRQTRRHLIPARCGRADTRPGAHHLRF